MLLAQMQRAIAQAYATVTKAGGRGELVADQLVLTATHCVAHTTVRRIETAPCEAAEERC